MKVIIYNQNNGIPAVMFPMPECLASHSIESIAAKDVPAGKPFSIVESETVPWEIPQEAWVVNEADLNDGIGNTSNDFED